MMGVAHRAATPSDAIDDGGPVLTIRGVLGTADGWRDAQVSQCDVRAVVGGALEWARSAARLRAERQAGVPGRSGTAATSTGLRAADGGAS
jgi:hypothetical protein